MNIGILMKEIRYEYSKQSYKPKGFCKCKNPIMIEDDGIRCVVCRKWIEIELSKK